MKKDQRKSKGKTKVWIIAGVVLTVMATSAVAYGLPMGGDHHPPGGPRGGHRPPHGFPIPFEHYFMDLLGHFYQGGEDLSHQPQELTPSDQLEVANPNDQGQSSTDLGDQGDFSYTIVDTGQANTVSINGKTPQGQDGHYTGLEMAYTNNGDGTITDLNTQLMWTQDPGDKMTYEQALAKLEDLNTRGYTDWRLPTIKELYSLIDFSGKDISPENTTVKDSWTPFINQDYFAFEYGDPSQGERVIDAQFLSSTIYTGTTMNGNETAFGVNFADGRIKGYPIHNDRSPNGEKTFFVLFVRGHDQYGLNHYVDNGDGTVTDLNTGLMWLQGDSGGFDLDQGGALTWEEGLAWAEDLSYAGYDDWRVPNAKELQSIVDYGRSPQADRTPAIDPIFSTTSIVDEGGQENYPFYWSSTLHFSQAGHTTGVYFAFGEALGFMNTPRGLELMDVHGAGAQRTDPLEGDASDYPSGKGPQGDVIRIQNFVRPVRWVEVVD